jgi:hypothetical protein
MHNRYNSGQLQIRLGVYPALDAGLQVRHKTNPQGHHRAFRYHPAALQLQKIGQPGIFLTSRFQFIPESGIDKSIR